MTDPQGRLIWISDGLPGSTHDLSAACTPSVFAVAACAELYLSADKGLRRRCRSHLAHPGQRAEPAGLARDANRCHTAIRAHSERGSAVLKTWKIFDRYRGCPRRVGTFARAVLTLEQGPQ